MENKFSPGSACSLNQQPICQATHLKRFQRRSLDDLLCAGETFILGAGCNDPVIPCLQAFQHAPTLDSSPLYKGLKNHSPADPDHSAILRPPKKRWKHVDCEACLPAGTLEQTQGVAPCDFRFRVSGFRRGPGLESSAALLSETKKTNLSGYSRSCQELAVPILNGAQMYSVSLIHSPLRRAWILSRFKLNLKHVQAVLFCAFPLYHFAAVWFKILL